MPDLQMIIGAASLALLGVLLLLWFARRPHNRSSKLTVRVVGRFPFQPETWDTLTKREKQVALLAARGLRNSDIATQLHVSQHTVDSHIKHAYAKLNVHNRVELSRLLRDVELDD